MAALEQTLLAVLIVSLVSLAGIFTITINEKKLKNVLFIFVSFAAGTMLAGAFFDLLPEAALVKGVLITDVFLYALIGVIVFFVVESVIHLYHCHFLGDNHYVKPVTYLNLVGDGLHNFLDGIAIAVSFLTSTEIGIAVTLAVIFHEIPQEIGDFSVLLYGGFSKAKALGFNFLTALTAFAGAFFAYFFSIALGPTLTAFLLAFSGGGFLYMAAANLIPEMHKEENFSKSLLQLIALLVGVVLIFAITKL